MSDATIAGALLGHPSIVTLVGSRRAFVRLPQGSEFPAVVYDVESSPVLVINAAAGPQLMRTRLQVTALGRSIGDVEAVRAAVREAIKLTSGTVAGHRVVSVVPDVEMGADRDDEAGVWFRHSDYLLHWYE